MDRGQKSVWYKRAQHTLEDGVHLQHLMSEALSQLADPFARLWAPSGDSGGKLAINAFSSHHGALVGQFVSFEPGHQQAVIKLAGGTEAFDISTMPPGADGEFLEGICYFYVFQDHVLFVQAKSLGTREFERYLSWLLATATSVIQPETVLIIADQPTTATQRRVANKRVRGVTFGTPLRPVAAAETVNDKSVMVYEASGSAWEGLRAFLGADVFDQVKMTAALDSAQVEVQVTVRVTGKRSVSDDAHRMLGAIARAARHVDPDDIELEVQGVGTLKGADLKIHKVLSLKLLSSGGLVEEGELWQKMSVWFHKMISDGTILG